MMPKLRGLADLQRAVEAIDAAARGAGLRAADPAARAGRDPRRAARGAGAGRAPAHRVAVLRPDGLRLGAPRRDPGQSAMSVAAASSSIRWCCAPSWRSRPPATPSARRRRTAWSPSSRTPPRCRPRPRRPRAQLGYTRMWSIHPAQIRAIVDAFAPTRGRGRPGHRDPAAPRRPPTGRRSATATRCTTAPATATSGRCWSARTRPRTPAARSCRPRCGQAFFGDAAG